MNEFIMEKQKGACGVFGIINNDSFDTAGNYNFGLKEHSIFLEVPQDDVIATSGMQITIKTTAKTKEQ